MRKIKNLVIDSTDFDLKLLREQVISEKSRLLSGSEWTQLLDSGLTIQNQLDWMHWRDSIKDLKFEKYTLEQIRDKLDNLKDNRPEEQTTSIKNCYINNLIDSHFKAAWIKNGALKKFINSAITNYLQNLSHYGDVDELRDFVILKFKGWFDDKITLQTAEFGHSEMFREKYEECLEYVNSEVIGLTSYPIIRSICQQKKIPPEQLCEQVINDRIRYLRILMEAEVEYEERLNQIKNADEGELLELLQSYGHRYRPTSVNSSTKAPT